MADRALVSLDQTASPHPPLPRQQRQRDPPPDLCRDDRLRAAAHRRPPPLRQDLDPALHRSGRLLPLTTPPPRRHRQTPAHQLKPPAMPKRQKSIELQLCLSFPGQPCALREREGPSPQGWEGEGCVHHPRPPAKKGGRCRNGGALSKASPTPSAVSSSKARPVICSPSGSPSLDSPAGT